MKHKYYTTTIKRIEKESDKVTTFVFDTSVVAKPGQYIMAWIPRVNEKPFGVVSDNPLTISVASVGPFTEQVSTLKVGDTFTFRGPYGTSFDIKGKHELLVGGGYGVVPLYFLASQIPVAQRQFVTVVIGAKTKTDIVYDKKFRDLGCAVVLSTDDGTAGFKGFSTDVAKEIIHRETIDSIYTCGPEIMMKKIAQMAHNKHIFCQVSVERHFKCGGIGLCGECSLNGILVCNDGPVLYGPVLV